MPVFYHKPVFAVLQDIALFEKHKIGIYAPAAVRGGEYGAQSVYFYWTVTSMLLKLVAIAYFIEVQ
ncbi:MAG TPA: hypothetical protein VK206_19820 [Anaerolineales bacterium]|nr:hypothetical protein [Anaerolineales bacterium]HLO30156.1 hypothetical protein [Anaerolineales bacterium]